MASSLVVEDPSISKISARPTGQMELQGPWKLHDFRPILCRVASTGLLATIIIILWPSNGKRETI